MASPTKEADFSTLSVYTYNAPLAARFVSAGCGDATVPSLLAALFGPRRDHSVFSITANAEGDFLVMDASLHDAMFSAQADKILWSCLYLHEASENRTGAEVSGALSKLCDRLAAGRVAVLNVCTLARNFMLVKEEAAERALATLRGAVEVSADEAAEPPSKRQQLVPPPVARCASRDVQIELLPATVAVGSLTVAELKRCSHAFLMLFFLRPCRPAFAHYFEMGGEVSVAVEEAALERVRSDEPESAATLDAALAPGLTRGWRVLDVTVRGGSEGVGILGQVCGALASLPLMNFSTNDHTYVLVREEHRETALALLGERFDVRGAIAS